MKSDEELEESLAVEEQDEDEEFKGSLVECMEELDEYESEDSRMDREHEDIPGQFMDLRSF